MMSSKLTSFIKTSKRFLNKRSPEILTGLGITGMITTTVLAVKATPKALILIEKAKQDLDAEKLTPVETVKAAWKPYISPVLICAASVTCLIGASAVNSRRNAALATAYALSERTLVRYKDKVIETIGEKKEKDIREKISQDELERKPVSGTQVIITPKGNTLFMESISGRYFRSDMDTIKKAVIELNREIFRQNYISLNEFYYLIGLEPTKNGDYLGWKQEDDYIDMSYNTCLAEDEPCIVLDYKVTPKYDFDKFA